MNKNIKKECDKSHPKIEFTENGNILKQSNCIIVLLKDGSCIYKANK